MELQAIYDLMSGRRRGMGAAVMRWLLWLAQGPYAAATTWRNRRYDRGNATIRRVDAPVISVGNITTGGTGKTPMVEFLARWYRERQVRVAIVSRGYGAEEGARNDEAMELERRLPDVPHLQHPDRFVAATTAIEELESQLILMDDGFQHRRLHRDLDIVLLDALEPFGHGHLLPRGLLRESLRGLRRADAIVLSRADAAPPRRRAEIRDAARRWSGDKPWIEVAHAPTGWVNGNDALPLDALQARRVAAFCGIGNPDGFRHCLQRSGQALADLRVFPDHHNYSAADIASLAAWASAQQVDAVVCTEKDWVKVQLARLGPCPLWALRISLEVQEGREQLESLLWRVTP